MAAIDVMRRYLQAVQRGDRATGSWRSGPFEANQYEVDDLFADPPPGG